MAVLTLADIRRYLRYEADDASNDDPLELMLEGGQRYIENYTGHLLGQREVVETPVTFPTARRTNEVPYFDLRWKPYVADSLEVGYLDSAYAEQTFEDVTIYAVDGVTRVIPTSAWPGSYVGITFAYSAGYETVDDVPADLLHALAIYAGMSDEDRAAPGSDGWKAIHELLEHYRMPVLA